MKQIKSIYAEHADAPSISCNLARRTRANMPVMDKLRQCAEKLGYHLGHIDPKMEKVIDEAFDEAFDALFEDEEESKKEQK